MGKSVQVHKPHKTRFASKSTRNIHRVSQTDKARISKEQKHVGKGGRAARIQRNKMARDQKRAALLKLKRATSGGSTPPRVIVLFGLSDEVNLGLLREDILKLLAPTGTKSGSCTVASSDFKIRTTILEAPHGDLLSCMEMAKVADLIVFVSSGNSVLQSSDSSGFVDSFACHCLSVMRTVGFPSTAVFMRDLPADLKGRQDFKKACISCLTPEVPEECKFYFADSKDDLNKFLCIFKEQHLTIPHWRANRPYILSDEVKTENDNDDMGKCHLVLSGYLRAHSLSVNQLVHVSGAGDFQLSKIEVLIDPYPMNYRPNSNSMESDESNRTQILRTLVPDISKLEPLLVENAYDLLVGEQTWPTEEEMLEAENANKGKKLKKKVLPQGTSDYQAAWIVDETDDENSNIDEDEDDGMVLDIEKNEQSVEDVSDADAVIHMKDVDEQTETDTLMADDENLTREQIEEEIQRLKEAHAEEEEFPDEVDTPLDVPAKRRFAKYRGLKSFRTSSWDPKESLPPEYARIFAFDNFIRTQKHALAKVRETDQSNADQSVPVGSYVKLYFKQVPLDMSSKVCSVSNHFPVVASGLLQHESKMSVLHFSIKKHESYDLPIKSKESLVFHVGFRQFVARPIFSSDNLQSDKHKMERFLHPGCFSIASIYAPISFPPLPMIALKFKQGSQPVLAATGSLRSVDPDRIILKKIILTGYPQRVSKLKATVRFMFHNPDDVRWFKPVDLWTKCGRRGRVMDSVGTHGAMKCVFDGVVQQHDTVCLSLYKRIYPKWPGSCYAVKDRYF